RVLPDPRPARLSPVPSSSLPRPTRPSGQPTLLRWCQLASRTTSSDSYAQLAGAGDPGSAGRPAAGAEGEQTMSGLTGAINAMLAYIPNILAAIAILLVGWLVAILLRNVVRGLLRHTPLNAALGRTFGAADAAQPIDGAEILGAV